METPPPVMEPLDSALALRLLRRAAGARGVAWPSDPTGVAGFRADLTGRGGRETLVWGTLGKDDGILALFDGEKLLAVANRSLGAITNVQLVRLPGLPHLAVMADDLYDEMFGAYMLEKRRRIWVWDGKGLRQAWRGNLASEQYHHVRWTNPSGPQQWQLDRTRSEVSLVGGELVQRLTEQTLWAPGRTDQPIGPLERFRVVDSKESTRRFQWNARLRRFEQAG